MVQTQHGLSQLAEAEASANAYENPEGPLEEIALVKASANTWFILPQKASAEA